MSRRRGSLDPGGKASSLASIIKNARLIWRLLTDGRISPWLKAIIPFTLLYLLSPIDLVPDIFLGLGQLDDLAIILLGIKLFLFLCPQGIVEQHLREMASIPGSYRVVEEEREEVPTSYIEAPYQVIEDEKED